MAHIGNTSTYVPPAALTTLSASLTLSDALRRKVVMKLTAESASGYPTSVTVGGVEIISHVVGANPDVHTSAPSQKHWEYWYDVPSEIAAGSTAIVVTLSAARSAFSWHAWEIVDAADGAPNSTQFADGNSSVTATVTATANAALVAVANASIEAGTITISGTCGERAENDETDYTSASADASVVAAGARTCTAANSAGGSISLRLSAYAASGPTPAAIAYYRRHLGGLTE